MEEETFVLVDLPTFVPMLPGETLRFERLDTDAPVLKTSTGKNVRGVLRENYRGSATRGTGG